MLENDTCTQTQQTRAVLAVILLAFHFHQNRAKNVCCKNEKDTRNMFLVGMFQLDKYPNHCESLLVQIAPHLKLYILSQRHSAVFFILFMIVISSNERKSPDFILRLIFCEILCICVTLCWMLLLRK